MTGSTWRKADMAIGDEGKIVSKHNPNSVLYGTVGSLISNTDFSFYVNNHASENAYYYVDWEFYRELELPTVPGSVVVVRDPSTYFHLGPAGYWVSDGGSTFGPDQMKELEWVLVYDNKKEAA